MSIVFSKTGMYIAMTIVMTLVYGVHALMAASARESCTTVDCRYVQYAGFDYTPYVLFYPANCCASTSLTQMLIQNSVVIFSFALPVLLVRRLWGRQMRKYQTSF